MAQRKIQKRELSPARARAGRARQEPETLESVRRERDALKAELAAARAEIARLKDVHTQVLNRIDWIVDSLNSLSDDQP